jgi:3'-5' exonuclease
LDEQGKILWDKKASYLIKESDKIEDVYQRAGIYAEFGKIVCISVAFFYSQKNTTYLRVKSFYGDNEKDLLTDFQSLLNKWSEKKNSFLCAHNGKEFDFPFIARRMLINGIKLPTILDVAGKKPWEVQFLDTMELWKFGDYKHYTSLNLLAHIFNLKSPKTDLDGSMVGKTYWEEKDLNKIVKYCEQDVLTVAQLYLKYKGEDIVKDEQIEFISK